MVDIMEEAYADPAAARRLLLVFPAASDYNIPMLVFPYLKGVVRRC